MCFKIYCIYIDHGFNNQLRLRPSTEGVEHPQRYDAFLSYPLTKNAFIWSCWAIIGYITHDSNCWQQDLIMESKSAVALWWNDELGNVYTDLGSWSFMNIYMWGKFVVSSYLSYSPSKDHSLHFLLQVSSSIPIWSTHSLSQHWLLSDPLTPSFSKSPLLELNMVCSLY